MLHPDIATHDDRHAFTFLQSSVRRLQLSCCRVLGAGCVMERAQTRHMSYQASPTARHCRTPHHHIGINGGSLDLHRSLISARILLQAHSLPPPQRCFGRHARETYQGVGDMHTIREPRDISIPNVHLAYWCRASGGSAGWQHALQVATDA